MESQEAEVRRRPHLMLMGLGAAILVVTTSLAIQSIWEETYLTLEQGPQMIGFSLAHGPWAVLLFAPIGLLLWLIVALLVGIHSVWRTKRFSKAYWSLIVVSVSVLGLLILPPVFWQWLLISRFAKNPYAAEFMVNAAAEGDLRTVRAYLAHGVSLESKNYEGSTATYTAAVGGSVEVLSFLLTKGANANAVNLYGDSPLEAAIDSKRDPAVALLRMHGAAVIRGTPEQREAASEFIVRRDMDRMHPHSGK